VSDIKTNGLIQLDVPVGATCIDGVCEMPAAASDPAGGAAKR